MSDEEQRARFFASSLRELAATIERAGVGVVAFGHFTTFRMADGSMSRITGADVGSLTLKQFVSDVDSIVEHATKTKDEA